MKSFEKLKATEEEKREAYLECKIGKLSKKYDKYHRIVNKESLWLFVATASCWSITERYFQAGALVTTFLFFVSKILLAYKPRSTFNQMFNDVERQIGLAFGYDEKTDLKERLKTTLIETKNKKENWPHLIKAMPLFLVAMLFYGATVLYVADKFEAESEACEHQKVEYINANQKDLTNPNADKVSAPN